MKITDVPPCKPGYTELAELARTDAQQHAMADMNEQELIHLANRCCDERNIAGIDRIAYYIDKFIQEGQRLNTLRREVRQMLPKGRSFGSFAIFQLMQAGRC